MIVLVNTYEEMCDVKIRREHQPSRAYWDDRVKRMGAQMVLLSSGWSYWRSVKNPGCRDWFDMYEIVCYNEWKRRMK